MVGGVNTIPIIPGIAGLGNLPAVAAYSNIIKKGEAKQLAAVAAAPQVAKEQKYFQSALSRMDSVDDLMKDRRALQYVLTAYGLGSEGNKTGIIKKVLTEDPSQRRSLVNSLADSKWRTLAVDLDTFNSGLGKLKGETSKDSFSVSTIGNRYLAVMQQDALGITTNTFFSNSFDLSVLSSGKVATSEGYVLAGYKLDNLGQVQFPDPNKATNTVSVVSKKLDDKGININVNVSQTLTRVSGDTWLWSVKDGNDLLHSQQVDIKFAPNGTVITVDGSVDKKKTVALDWGTNGTTTEKFDLEQIFKDTRARDTKPIQVNWFDGKKTASKTITPYLELNKTQAVADTNFYSNVVTQKIKNPDKAVYSTLADNPSAQSVGIQNSLVRVSGDTWQWTVKNGTQTLMDRQVELTFDNEGKLETIDGNAVTSSTETLDWGGAGTTSQSIDLAKVFEKSPETTNIALKQTFTHVSGDTWQWKVMKGNEVMKDEPLDITFKTDGTVATINGEDGATFTSNFNYGGYVVDVEHDFNFNTAFQRADFMQMIRVTDNIGVDRNVRIDYNRTGDPENRWQAKVWYEDGNTLAGTFDFSFDANGKVVGVGKYDSGTGIIANADGSTKAKTATVHIDWQRSQGSSELTLDFANIFSHGSLNAEVRKPVTDSIALGKRKAVNIDDNGNVIATYAKADGSGEVKFSLYRLMSNTFESPASLLKDEATGYLKAGVGAGINQTRPLGTDKNLLDQLLDGFAGKLSKAERTSSNKTTLEIISDGYNQNIFEQALGKENVALRYALYFKNNASKMTTVYHVLGDRAMRDVVSTVFNIPEKVATQPIATQAAVFERKLDLAKFKDPKYVDQFIQRFLSLSGSSSGGGASGYQAGLLGGGDSGSLLTMVAQNINILT